MKRPCRNRNRQDILVVQNRRDAEWTARRAVALIISSPLDRLDQVKRGGNVK